MSFYSTVNNATAVIATPHTAGDGRLYIDPIGVFGSGGFPLRVTCVRQSDNAMAIYAISGSGATYLNISAAIEGTVDIDLATNDVCQADITAGALKDIHDAINAISVSGGLSGTEGAIPIFANIGFTQDPSRFNYDNTTKTLNTTKLLATGVVATPTINCGIQGGTVNSPAAQMLLKHQPRDPSFARWELSSIGSFFEGIWDPILQFGYNTNQNDADPGRNDESSLYLGFEANYFEPPTQRYTAESYVQYNPPRDAAVQFQRRPWMFTLDKETGSTRYSIEVGPPQVGFGYFQVVGGIGTGGSFQLMSIVTGEDATTGMTRIFTPLEVSNDTYLNRTLIVNREFSCSQSAFDTYIGTSSYDGAYRLNISTTARTGSRHIILGRNIQGADTSDYITSATTFTGYAGIEYRDNGDIRFYSTSGATTASGAVTPSSRFTIFANTGWLGVNEASPGAQMQITTSSTTTKGLIVKGVSSQSANLLELQNSSNTAMSYFDSVGRFVGPANQYKAFQIPGNGSFASAKDIAYIASLATDGVPLAIQGYTGGGQTANLTEWRNAGFGVVASISPIGGLTASAGAVLKAAGTNAKVLDIMSTTGQVGGNSADIRFFVPAAGLENPITENLWGAKISAVSNPGNTTASLVFHTNFPHAVLDEKFRIDGYEGRVGVCTPSPIGQLHATSYSTTTPTAIFQARAASATITNVSLTSNVATITTSAPHGLRTNDVVVISGLATTALNGSYGVNWPADPSSTTFTINKTNANIPSTADSGTATVAQTANLTEWRDSSGSVMCYMSVGGSLVMKGGVSTNNVTFDNGVNSWQWYRPGTDTNLYLRDITNARMQITLVGGASANAAITSISSLVGINEASPGAQLQVTTSATGRKGLIVKSTLGQAVNLIEVQNSSGVNLAYVTQFGEVGNNGLINAISSVKTSAYTIGNSDSTIIGDSTSSGFNINLPAASSVNSGRIYTIKNIGSANTVSVVPVGGDLIDGSSSYPLSTQYQFVTIQSNGSTVWHIIGR